MAIGCLKEALGHCPTCSGQNGTNTQKQILPNSVGPEFVEGDGQIFLGCKSFWHCNHGDFRVQDKSHLHDIFPPSLVTQSPQSQLLMDLNVWTNHVPWTCGVWAFCRKWQCHPCSSLLICQHDFHLEEKEAECVKIVDYGTTNELYGKGYWAEAYQPWEFSSL